MSLSFFTNTKTGKIMNRVSSDVDNVDNVVTGTFVTIVTNVAVIADDGRRDVHAGLAARAVRARGVPLMILPLSPVGRRMYGVRK